MHSYFHVLDVNDVSPKGMSFISQLVPSTYYKIFVRSQIASKPIILRSIYFAEELAAIFVRDFIYDFNAACFEAYSICCAPTQKSNRNKYG